MFIIILDQTNKYFPYLLILTDGAILLLLKFQFIIVEHTAIPSEVPHVSVPAHRVIAQLTWWVIHHYMFTSSYYRSRYLVSVSHLHGQSSVLTVI